MLNDLGHASAWKLRFRVFMSFVYYTSDVPRVDAFIVMTRGCRYNLQDSRVNATLRGHQELM